MGEKTDVNGGRVTWPTAERCVFDHAPCDCRLGAPCARFRPDGTQIGRVTYRVEKQDYSHGAWRVLDAEGQQVWREETFDHPNLGEITIPGPVCFQRKRDAVAWVAAQIGRGSDG